ncbi:MAG: class I SAM-dependent methyltransferase [Betaproteobacteria bacterium]
MSNSARAYREPAGPKLNLPPNLLEPVIRKRAIDADVPSGTLYEIWREIPGAHKWLHYFQIYEALFIPLTGKPIRMLEIGVYKGGSLAMWRQYLHPESVIVGIDIDPACASYDAPGQNMHVRIGDQADAEFLHEVSAAFGPFDVILDDGSHLCSHMLATFGNLFLGSLKDDGVYIAEDTHTNFWDGFRDQGYSFIDLSKDLVDLMHSHYVHNDFEKKFRLGGPDQLVSVAVPRISAHIKEINFHDSIVVIRKQSQKRLPASQHR